MEPVNDSTGWWHVRLFSFAVEDPFGPLCKLWNSLAARQDIVVLDARVRAQRARAIPCRWDVARRVRRGANLHLSAFKAALDSANRKAIGWRGRLVTRLHSSRTIARSDFS